MLQSIQLVSICSALYEYSLFSNSALGQSIIFINALLVINRPSWSISISSIFNLQFLSACKNFLQSLPASAEFESCSQLQEYQDKRECQQRES